MSTDYKIFDYNNGFIVVTNDAKIFDEFAKTTKWALFLLRNTRSVKTYVLASKDIVERLQEHGLPPEVKNFLNNKNRVTTV